MSIFWCHFAKPTPGRSCSTTATSSNLKWNWWIKRNHKNYWAACSTSYAGNRHDFTLPGTFRKYISGSFATRMSLLLHNFPIVFCFLMQLSHRWCVSAVQRKTYKTKPIFDDLMFCLRQVVGPPSGVWLEYCIFPVTCHDLQRTYHGQTWWIEGQSNRVEGSFSTRKRETRMCVLSQNGNC